LASSKTKILKMGNKFVKLQASLAKAITPHLPYPAFDFEESNMPMIWLQNLGDRPANNDNQVLGGNKEDLAASGSFQATFDLKGKAITFQLIPHNNHIHISSNEDISVMESFVFEFENDESFERHEATGPAFKMGVLFCLNFDLEQVSWTFRVGFQDAKFE